MRILITNDDGIQAPGLWAAVDAVKDLGKVIVVAPDREQSGVGSGITMNKPIHATEIQPLITGVQAFSVDAKPADCAILGIESLSEDPIDMVISGINQGANLGQDIFISGTVGAAIQGFFRDIPSIAVSVAALKNPIFEPAAQTIMRFCTAIRDKEIEAPLLLNINLPNLTSQEIKETRITTLGGKIYGDVIAKYNNGKTDYYWISKSKKSWIEKPDQDISAINQQSISITPLNTNLTTMKNPTGLENLVKHLHDK
jgi:5'-nucleotidase